MSSDLVRAETGELVELGPANLFGTDNPAAVVERAANVATALTKVVQKQKLTTKISGKDYPRVECWTLLGSMLGVFPVCVWTRKLEDGWEARVEARTLSGQIVGAAEAECLRSESLWKNRDDYALRSMAQTRATSKALRQPLGFVISMAGLEATPAEEMPGEREDSRKQTKEQQQKLDKLLEEIGRVQPEPPETAESWRAYAEKVCGEWFGGRAIADLDRGQMDTLVQRIDKYVEEVKPF